MSIQKRVARKKTLPLLALRGLVIFPGMLLHFDVGRRKSVEALNDAMNADQLIYLVTQKDITSDDPPMEALYAVGVVAKVRQVLKLPGDNLRILVEGLYRARHETAVEAQPYFRVVTRECLERRITDALQEQALMRECCTYFETYAALSPKLAPDVPVGIKGAEDAGRLADYIASNLPLAVEEKQRILSATAVARRMEEMLVILTRETAILRLEQGIQNQVRERMDQNQRDYYLREQMRVIADELGEGENPLEEADVCRKKVLALTLPQDTQDKLLKECDKLAKMPAGSHEGTVVRTYLDTVLALPWNTETKDNLALDAARRVLDRDHYGMDKVKDRILETLAVRKLAPDMPGQVLCLVGPPGVGKTSIARSIAAAMGRKYVRVSLGGMRDEADIRGHRKTYIGAMPGRIMAAVKQAGSRNPLVLLDEIDKMGHDFRGDPASAMLEVLDGEQNNTFTDHYIEVPFDLSKVLFVTTANELEPIPAPLRDRMDIIELPSYTAEEKFHIAKEHLWRKQVKRNGLTLRQVRMPDDTLRRLIEGYTKEAGVRSLERCIAQILRKCARAIAAGEAKSLTVRDLEAYLGPVKFKPDDEALRDQVGMATGLAWTAVGGETLPVEVAVLEGSGKIELTGSLGDVMKESARTAISYVRSRVRQLPIEADFYKTKDIHIHVPEGAVPKDGPSAGVTMTTALISALTGIPVRGDVAMTGEISLRGRVLPIGGLREKTMAAYCRHIRTVIIPAGNASDLAEIDQTVRAHVQFVTAEHLDTVIRTALVTDPLAAPAGDAADSRPLPVTARDVQPAVPQ